MASTPGCRPRRSYRRHAAIGCLLAALAFISLPVGGAASSGLRGHAAVRALRPGRFGKNSVLLVNGRVLTPAGTQTQLKPLPFNAMVSPNGRDVLVSSDGRGTQFLQVISSRTLRTIQRIAYPNPEGLFIGLAYSSDGKYVFASGGGQDVVHAFTVAANGTLTPNSDINLFGPGNWNPFPIGLALTDNNRLLMVAESHTGGVAIGQPSTKRIVRLVRVGVYPYTVVAGSGDEAYVSNWGSSSVSVLEVPARCATSTTCPAKVLTTIRVGAHPSAMVVGGDYLYVADSNRDRVSIISTTSNQVVGAISVGQTPTMPLGSSPEGLALSSNHQYLYVANSGDNAIVVVQLLGGGATGQIVGRIPTAEYPISVALGPGDKKLYVTNAMGDGTVANTNLSIGSYNRVNGILSTIPVPSASTLQKDTAQVAQNDNTSDPFLSERPTDSPVPLLGGKSPIKHVIYIVKENQTYDQIFGDIKQADGDPRLAVYGEHVTPNLHALARRFGIFDNFYDDGMSSSDGHNWAMSADDDDFNEVLWPQGYAHRSVFGINPGESFMDLSPGGYLWDRANQEDISYRDYGEFYRSPVRDRTFIKPSDAASCPGPVASTYVGMAIPTGYMLCLPPSQTQPVAYVLTAHHDPRYRGLDLRYSDIYRIEEWDREFENFVTHKSLPALEIMWLPNDHTAAGSGFLSGPSYVSQNDRAVGMLVDAVSHSKYWKSTAIFITQDDPQGARDHVNSQRTECLVISPYTQTTQPVVNSELYDNSSMLRTIELILNLKPMSEFDATADPMWHAFHPKPDLTPFTALHLSVPPTQQ